MNNINDKGKMSALLKIAAEKLGTTPENLSSAAKSGDMGKLLKENESQKVNEVINNPEKLRELLKSEEAKKLMKAFGLKGSE